MNPRATLDATVRFLSRNLQAMGSSSEHNLSSFRVKVSISNPPKSRKWQGPFKPLLFVDCPFH